MADENLRAKVFQQIRAEIIAGHAKPGDMYSVPSLATSFQISSTPVREALLELVQLGLLESHRNRGFRVTTPSIEETRNIFDMRDVLETYAARTVARMPGLDLSPLVAVADEIADSVARRDFRNYLIADRKYHHVLIALADNPILTHTIFSLRDRMRFYGENSAEGRERQEASVGEHYRIIEYVRAGDVGGVDELLRSHIRAWEPLFETAIPTLHHDPAANAPKRPLR
ncbi:GntR family transcriptional regulator [Aureimonas flava]|uniref:GntR family transcriptional regulator n=2 Tax=Aureimonas flava TaxID=2320271 RepID=A0A3A1WRP1_9HYPH|nr:GntR family transcriptional regulator [Aureimonas flava]